MHLIWNSSPLALAATSDTLVSLLLVAILTAIAVAVVAFWLASRRWGPAVRQLAGVLDREARNAEQSANALSQHANAQSKRVARQAASVRGAIEGIRTLHHIMTDLNEHATGLRQIAQQINAESSMHGGPSRGLADQVHDSAVMLAQTAEQTHQTYRRLLNSVNQLVTESEALHLTSEDAERHAVALTGALDRVNAAVNANRPKLLDKRSARRLPDAEKSRPPRGGPEPWAEWSGEDHSVAEQRLSRRLTHNHEEPRPRPAVEDLAEPPRKATRNRPPDDFGRSPPLDRSAAANRRTTRDRQRDEPNAPRRFPGDEWNERFEERPARERRERESSRQPEWGEPRWHDDQRRPPDPGPRRR